MTNINDILDDMTRGRSARKTATDSASSEYYSVYEGGNDSNPSVVRYTDGAADIIKDGTRLGVGGGEIGECYPGGNNIIFDLGEDGQIVFTVRVTNAIGEQVRDISSSEIDEIISKCSSKTVTAQLEFDDDLIEGDVVRLVEEPWDSRGTVRFVYEGPDGEPVRWLIEWDNGEQYEYDSVDLEETIEKVASSGETDNEFTDSNNGGNLLENGDNGSTMKKQRLERGTMDAGGVGTEISEEDNGINWSDSELPRTQGPKQLFD